MKTLRLILGDQLNLDHSWFKKQDSDVTYVLMEIKSETNYVAHHIQKVVGIFANMRNFSETLKKKGHEVIHIKLNDKNNLQQFDKNCQKLIEKFCFQKFEYQEADEYRVDKHLKQFAENLLIPSKIYSSEHFFTTRTELANQFEGKKSFLMETFYRKLRVKHQILMLNEKEPLFGKWNFDEDNREKLPKNHIPISPLLFSNEVSEIVEEIEKAQINTIGSIDKTNFIWPVNRSQALDLLDFFVENCLPLFGTFQDAMAINEWSIYHSRLSFSLNIKVLSPQEVIQKAISHYHCHENSISFNQLEGFVRQILGWREYIRGIYWTKMPAYSTLNFFGHKNKLPSWFWDGKTKMNCLKQSIQQSLHFAYAHHIQRLMITGNFALLTGIHPDEVDAWYLGIYIDAFDWVEITNTRGMSQYADGGVVGTKPYVSSSSYIHKMSNYCGTCYYKQSKKTGSLACPFNSLYWHFYARNEDKLASNPRIGMMYHVWRKMTPENQQTLINQAETYLAQLNDL